MLYPILKPCPCCAAVALYRKRPIYDYPGCYTLEIQCSKCGLTMIMTQANTVFLTEEEAFKLIANAWNRRAYE